MFKGFKEFTYKMVAGANVATIIIMLLVGFSDFFQPEKLIGIYLRTGTKQIKKPKNGIMAYLDRKSNQKSKKPKLTIRKTGKSKPRLANAANFSG